MKRSAILLMIALLLSCRERAARSPSPIDSAPDASSSVVFASMQQRKDVRAGAIHNRIMGLEGEIPSGPVSRNEVTLGALRQSVEVRLTRETRIDEGVRISAVDKDGTEYSTLVARDAVSVAGHDDIVFGFYFSVPFENKPWSHTLTWRLAVYAGREMVAETALEVPARDLIVYERRTDDPLDVIDITHLIRGRTYKLFYKNLPSDLLIAYYTSDYSTYMPFYVGRADLGTDPHFVPEITISAQARAGAYFFTHKARARITGSDEDYPVFGYKVIE